MFSRFRLWRKKRRWNKALCSIMNWLLTMGETRGIILAWDKDPKKGSVWLTPHRIDELYKRWEDTASTKVWAQAGIPIACYRCEKHIHYPPVQIPVAPPKTKDGNFEWEVINGNFHISCAFEMLLGIRAAQLTTERKDERNPS